MFVTQSRCGIGFFSTPWIELWSSSSSFDRLHGLPDILDRTGKEPAGTAGRVEDRLAELRVHLVHHELRHGPGRVILPGIARTLEVF